MDGIASLTVPAPSKKRRIALTISYHALMWGLLIAISWYALVQGFALRKFTYEISKPIRFTSDITRGWGWGYDASGAEGYLNLYERMEVQAPQWSLWLDYAPLRLGVMTMWAKYNRSVYNDPMNPDGRRNPKNIEAWRPEYEFTRPVLYFNTGMEILGAICAFLLVRLWVIRGDQNIQPINWCSEWRLRFLGKAPPMLPITPAHRPFRGWGWGMIGALLLWFNPAMIHSAHTWPTWDMWVIPMYLLAVLLACYDCWVFSGMVLAWGVMFKGQQLLGVPVFLCWTILTGRWICTLRWGCGFAIGLALVVWPWMFTRVPFDQLMAFRLKQFRNNPPWDVPIMLPRVKNVWAITWVSLVAIASIAAPILLRFKPNRWLAISLALCGILIGLPIFAATNFLSALICLALAISPLIIFKPSWIKTDHLPILRRWKSVSPIVGWRGWLSQISLQIVFTSSLVAIATLLCIRFFGSSIGWWTCGIKYGTIHWPGMVMGLTSNLPGLLMIRFGWGNDITQLVTLPALFQAENVAPGTILKYPYAPLQLGTVKQFLAGLFVTMLVPCLWAIARHARRQDPKFLVAITAPWIMFFCFPVQIHERYLLFAAGVGMVMIGQSVGMTLLAIFMTAVTWIMTIHVQLRHGSRAQLGWLLNKNFPQTFEKSSGETLFRFISPTHPDVGYAVLLIALIALYMAVRKTPSRKILPVLRP